LSAHFKFTVISRNHAPTAAFVVAGFIAMLAFLTDNTADKAQAWQIVGYLILAGVITAILNLLTDIGTAVIRRAKS